MHEDKQVEVKQLMLSPQKMKEVIERASENVKHSVVWDDPKAQDWKLHIPED